MIRYLVSDAQSDDEEYLEQKKQNLHSKRSENTRIEKKRCNKKADCLCLESSRIVKKKRCKLPVANLPSNKRFFVPDPRQYVGSLPSTHDFPR